MAGISPTVSNKHVSADLIIFSEKLLDYINYRYWLLAKYIYANYESGDAKTNRPSKLLSAFKILCIR
jgi:hypothetical protein